MTDFNQMVLDQRGSKKVDAYPSILPPKGPPPPGRVAQDDAPEPGDEWWRGAFELLEIGFAVASRMGLPVQPRAIEIYQYLLKREKRAMKRPPSNGTEN